jgi:arabinosaccharide transport system substrate-binding protein
VDFTGVYLLQQNPGMVTADGRIHLDTPIMAESLADLLLWCLGPDRVAAEVPHFTAATYQLLREGYVVAMPMPDWYSQLLINNLPGLSGKFKVMPLPAWEPGGRRTSVWGGTMMSLFRDSDNFEAGWRLAKELLLNREAAAERYRETGIIAPIPAFWDDPAFSEPNPFFSNQRVGELFIEQAPHVPTRYSSPYQEQALQQIQRILIATREKAEARKIYQREALIPLIAEQLKEAQAQVDKIMERNPYYP